MAASNDEETLRVLIKFRNEFREFRAETARIFARIDEHLDRFEQTLTGATSRLTQLNATFTELSGSSTPKQRW
jgi:hypothetical protein